MSNAVPQAFDAIANSEDGADKVSLDEFTFRRNPVTKEITCEVVLNLHYAGTPEAPAMVRIPIPEITPSVLASAKAMAPFLHSHALLILSEKPNHLQ